ncbi:MAG: HAD-IC family P-type ATPase [Fimbriimonadaceae bacterium]|nr:HAD-IC family P-type ATPase [Chthonomonadaceae bacterium]MCO5298062.1 HAD-IC family P-type ATPase [Fimbriimonadaceae bacterium]
MHREGLSGQEARRRLEQHGPNALPESSGPSLASRIAAQFTSPIVWLLVAAVGIDLAIWLSKGGGGVPLEAAAIALILVVNACLGVYQEYRADEALSKLQELAQPRSTVWRDGKQRKIPSRELVPGDVVRLETGDRVPADVRVVETRGILLDESMLTGESVPVDRASGEELRAGTRLVKGGAAAEVVRTGAQSALGKLASTLQGLKATPTPLERKLGAFGSLVSKWVAGLAAALVLGGVWVEGLDSLGHVLVFSIALAVAAVPEGMPAVMTLTLARGVERMARRNAVVRRMVAVEALGSVTVIATDKTGTLTENRMTVEGLECEEERAVLRAMVLANDAEPDSDSGDPLERALLEFARDRGVDAGAERERCPRSDELPFESKRKYMRVTCGDGERWLKGAPEVLLGRSDLGDEARKRWLARAKEAAAEGYRLLAFARGGDDEDRGVEFLGFAKLWDPPREEVQGALARTREAGVRVVMVTGDHPQTARAIADAIGLATDDVVLGEDLEGLDELPEGANVFARVQPEQKLALIERLQEKGHIVAMTGDGVNDAPALKRADVGIAMGRRGTDLAREVSDLVLTDDNFASIVAAIEHGRGIFANIQKFIRFLFATNFAELCVVVVGALGAFVAGMREPGGEVLLPLTAVQLLWINVVTDGPVALALGFDRNPGAMKRPPRPPDSPMLDRFGVRFVVGVGLLASAVGLALFGTLLTHVSFGEARSALFQFLAVGQLLVAYPARSASASRRNVALAASVVGAVGLQVAAATVPWLRTVLGLAPMTPAVAGAVAGAAVLSWALAEGLVRTPWLAGAAPARRVQSVL